MAKQPDVFSVSRLNQEARMLLETGLGQVWVEGEISNLAMPSSGHWYFSIKDSRAQVSCAMFKGNNSRLDFTPNDADQILVKARVSLYEPRGNYQLIVEKMQAAGDGALQRKFEQLKKKLAAEGLFDEQNKQEIPELPQTIGVITSSTGAAIHDILTVLKRRFAAIPVVIYPSMVQGERASQTIVKAIEVANQRQECDVLIVARGGGSLEDLWPFNEENVARAIYDSDIPIVTGVGHEVDVTIADFVADHRAATPSAAAEYVSPNYQQWLQLFQQFSIDLHNGIKHQLKEKSLQLRWLHQRLQHPGHKLQQQMQTVDHLLTRIKQAIRHKVNNKKQLLQELTRTLDAYSPLATLARGYAIVKKDKTVIHDTKQLTIGDEIKTQLHQGQITSQITEIHH